MDSLSGNLAFQYWTFTLVYLSLKMISNSVVQGFQRTKNRSFAHEEDAKFFGNATAGNQPELVLKAASCWRNDLENIPIFLIMGLAFVFWGGEAQTAAIYFITFCVGRTLHSFFFLKSLQPHRTIAFTIGALTHMVLLVHVLILAMDAF